MSAFYRFGPNCPVLNTTNLNTLCSDGAWLDMRGCINELGKINWHRETRGKWTQRP